MSQEVAIRKRIQRKETRYLRIVTEKIKSGKNNTAIAKQFGVDRRTVQRAFDWGYARGIFDVDIRERLFHHIIEFGKQLDWINEERRLAIDQTRDESGSRVEPLQPQQFMTLSREERETRVKVLELEGLYRNVLNIKPMGMGDEEKDIEVTWHVVDVDNVEIR